MVQESQSASGALTTTGGALVLFNIRCIVDRPDRVRVHEVLGSQSVVIEVIVEPPDYKRVIGRGGRTADAIRELLRSVGGKENRRYILEILEPGNRQEELPAGWQEPPLPAADGEE